MNIHIKNCRVKLKHELFCNNMIRDLCTSFFKFFPKNFCFWAICWKIEHIDAFKVLNEKWSSEGTFIISSSFMLSVEIGSVKRLTSTVLRSCFNKRSRLLSFRIRREFAPSSPYRVEFLESIVIKPTCRLANPCISRESFSFKLPSVRAWQYLFLSYKLYSPYPFI